MSDLIVDLDDEELNAARDWHGGQSSMLYAVASTGALMRGSIRPYERCSCSPSGDGCKACNGTFRIYMSDEEWDRYLTSKLESEASEAAAEARLRVKRAKHARRKDEAKEMEAYASALDSIAFKASLAARKGL